MDTRFTSLPLLCRQQQLVQTQAPRPFGHLRIDHRCAVRSNWNLAVRKPNVFPDVDLHFGGRDAQPEQRCLKRKRRNDFAAVLKKHRHMNIVDDLVRQIDETERPNQAHILVGLPYDSGELDQIATLPGYLRKSRNLCNWCVRIGRRRQFRPEQQLRYPHCLIEKNLLLILLALGPFQDRFKCDYGGLEFKRGLQKERNFKRRICAGGASQKSFRRIDLSALFVWDRLAANLDDRERRCRVAGLRILQKPA